VSWNTNGLQSSRLCGSRKLLVRQDLHRHVVGDVDILFVQEHKLSLEMTQRVGKVLPGTSRTFWEPATGLFSRSGGVCISVGPRWISAIRGHGTLVRGRAMWISLQLNDALIGFLTVYAPTEARLRASFWRQIVDVLPTVDSWIVGGDFNNVESLADVRASTPQLCLQNMLLLSQKHILRMLLHQTMSRG